ncbi:hypothetical protein V6D40_10535 [Corynebacterium sp. Q4381]|uniref:hypothetical protein n=1 Tax=Corynebacterium sp. Marseille-Q4381 TaxID=3121597 RepID=UPI002FE6C37D
MSVSRVLSTCGVLAVALLAGGCASSGDLDGVYTKVESAGTVESGSITSTLTISGDDCSIHDKAEPGHVERDQTCSVEGGDLIFTEGDSQAAVPFARTADGDVRIGVGDGELYRKTGEA